MKKLLVIVLVAALVLSGCSFGGKYSRAFKEKEANYQQMAQEYMAAGDYDSAVAALEKGLREIDSDVLRQLLEEAKSKRGWRPTAQNTTPAQENEAPVYEQPEYEATEYQPPVQETEPKRNPIHMSSSVQYEINIFLSNFAEQHDYCTWSVDLGETFHVNKPDWKMMVDFMLCYYNINVPGHVQTHYDGQIGYGKSSAKLSQVNKDMVRFFGTTVTESQLVAAGVEVSGGRVYTINQPDGPHSYLAVVPAMYDNGDGTYTAAFEVYTTNYMFDGEFNKAIYQKSASQIAADSGLDYLYSGEAVVRPYNQNGRNTYQLISYSLLK